MTKKGALYFKHESTEVNSVQIETSRLMIRNFEPGDAGDLQEILGDDEAMKNVEPAFSLEKTKHFLEDFCIGKGGAFAVVLKGSFKVIGYLLFKPVEEDVYEIGWIFNRHYWRNGYAYESSAALIRYGFRTWEIHKVIAETIDEEKSVGLMEKLGMKREGVQRKQRRDSEGNRRDLYLYGLLQEESER